MSQWYLKIWHILVTTTLLKLYCFMPSQFPPPHLAPGYHWCDCYQHRLLFPILELHTKGIVQYILFGPAFFTQHILWDSHMWLLISVIIFHCIVVPCFFLHLPADVYMVIFSLVLFRIKLLWTFTSQFYQFMNIIIPKHFLNSTFVLKDAQTVFNMSLILWKITWTAANFWNPCLV